MNPAGITAFIGIGANLGDPAAQVREACARLARDLPDSRLVARSSLYRNAPMGPQDQPDYVNAVARVLTRLDPGALLAELQRIETAMGRRRDGTRWGPRLLDLDILLYGTMRINEPGLHIPHPGIAERDFVLFPLRELAPDLEIPDRGTVAQLCRTVSAAGLVAIPEEARA
jgi:2-amino-4-hydroxy-6-hydroxymethyldihydropteridine diphosphokinase